MKRKLLWWVYISSKYLMHIFLCPNVCNDNSLCIIIVYTATVSTPLLSGSLLKSSEWQHCELECVGVSFVNFPWRGLATLFPKPLLAPKKHTIYRFPLLYFPSFTSVLFFYHFSSPFIIFFLISPFDRRPTFINLRMDV